METLYASLYTPSSCWLPSSTEWTKEENKKFESVLARIPEHDPLRWAKVASYIPGKTVDDVANQYSKLLEDVSNIEAGRIPIPGYLSSSFTFELVDQRDFDGYRKRPSTAKGVDQERKKGVPWTEDEHRRFLMGLMKHGKGDWRNISRNFVITKTPTQVASHAQKYFIRQQLSGVKDKRRPSIHDITTSNLTDTANPSDGTKSPSSVDQPDFLSSSPQKLGNAQNFLIDWNHSKDGSSSIMVFDSTKGNLFMSEAASNGLKLYGQNLNAGAHQGDRINPYSMYLQMHQVR